MPLSADSRRAEQILDRRKTQEGGQVSALKQTAVLTWMGLSSVRSRLGSSMVIIVGIAGVVAVLVSVLAVSTGLTRTLQSGGRDDRAVILRSGATSEGTGLLSREVVEAVLNTEGIARSAEQKPIASAEVLRMVGWRKQGEGVEVNLTLRGVGSGGAALRPEIKLLEGRMFTASLREVIVGRAALEEFTGLKLGSTIRVRNSEWTVVGVFSSNKDVHESELLTDVNTLMNAMGRTAFNSVTVQLADPTKFEEFKQRLLSNPAVSVDVTRERQFFALQSATTTSLIKVVAFLIGAIMAVGAVFTALNTMYAAVSARVREIATLRALGFRPSPVLLSVLVEAVLLSMAGGILGAIVARVLFNDSTMSTGRGTRGQVVFDLAVTADLAVLGITWAVVIGLIGGILPAIRAARTPVATSLRAV